jgi:HK97 family phage major capsid protein
MKPKRMVTAVEYTRKLLVQSSEDVEALVRADIAISQALALDLAIINGLGNENEPMGILNTTGVGNEANGDNGAAPDFDTVVNMETKIAVANALEGTTGYLTNPLVRGVFKKTAEISAANAIRIWQNNAGEPGAGIVNGYVARATNQIPSNLTKGNGTGLSAIIFGNWADYMAAQWDGVSAIVDPYTEKLKGIIGVVVEQFADGGCRHPASFCKSVDCIA